ncbi:hypothetical protein LTR17_022774 [Elasticomyces elasticus]|nr:hypothetical protein LTR17_022774 [Elasticomyces elasticus]
MLLTTSLLFWLVQAAVGDHRHAPSQQPLISTPLSIDVTFMPIISPNEPAVLNISVTLYRPNLAANASLVELYLAFGNVPCQYYNGTNPITAIDDDGVLELLISDDEEYALRRWLTARPTSGTVNISMTALPRHIDITTPIGPRVDLREIDGGLQGSGFSVVPWPPNLPEIEHDLNFCWDLSHSPPNTNFASSLGEDLCHRFLDRAQAKQGMQSTVFAVGSTLHRYPPVEQSPELSQFGLFYFGNTSDIPFDIEKLGDYINALFINMNAFFDVPNSRPCRVFLRPSLRGYGGAGFLSAFMLEYYPNMNVEQWELEWLLAHEVTHNWPLMDSSPGQPTQADNTWYNEGIATYYQMLLPHRFGHTTKEELVKQMNMNLQAYFTNPAIDLSNEEAAERMWTDPAAQRLPYHRGLVYFLRMGFFVSQASGGFVGIDDAVLELLEARRRGEPFGLDAWISLVGGALGDVAEAWREYNTMAVGGYLGLPPAALSYLGLRVVSVMQERLDLGFDPSSLNSRVIAGVITGSRAHDAGLREGDVLVENQAMYWQVADDISRNMTLKLKRDGQDFELTYWPRSRETVPSLQVEEAGHVHAWSDL